MRPKKQTWQGFVGVNDALPHFATHASESSPQPGDAGREVCRSRPRPVARAVRGGDDGCDHADDDTKRRACACRAGARTRAAARSPACLCVLQADRALHSWSNSWSTQRHAAACFALACFFKSASWNGQCRARSAWRWRRSTRGGGGDPSRLPQADSTRLYRLQCGR